MARKIHYGMMCQNNLFEVIPNLERALPYVDTITLIDGGCFVEGQPVYTYDGPKPIEQVTRGDKVFGMGGNLTEVRSLFNKEYEGDLVEVKPYNMAPIKMTGNHPVLILRGMKCGTASRKALNNNCKPWCSCGYWEDSEAIWVEARDIAIDDYVLIPATFQYKGEAEVSEDLAELWGWYMAEGSSSENGTVSFSLNIAEEKEARRIRSLLEKFYGLQATERSVPHKNERYVRVYSCELARMFKRAFGGTATTKVVPPAMFRASKSAVSSFLRAWLRGDGSVYSKQGKGPLTSSISTASLWAAYGAQQLFSYLRIVPSFSEEVREDRFSDGPIYKVVLNCGETDALFGCSCCIEPTVRKDAQETKRQTMLRNQAVFSYRAKYFCYDNFICVPVRKVSVGPFAGKVYNIETGDNSYLTGFVVHNSTDDTIIYMRNWSNEEPKIRFYVYPWRDDFPAQRNNYVRHIGEIAEPGDWVATADPDEFYEVQTWEKLHKAADRADSRGQNMIGFQCRSVSKKGGKRVFENLDDYWKELFFRWDPNFHYTGYKCHEGKGGVPHLIMRTALVYEHIKQENVIWVRGFRNMFHGGGGPNLGDRNPIWVRLRTLCRDKLGIDDWHTFYKYLLKGNIDQDIKRLLIDHMHEGTEKAGANALRKEYWDGASEMREMYKTYFRILHPEEEPEELRGDQIS